MNGYMPYTPGMLPAGLNNPADIQNRIQQLQSMQQQFQPMPQAPEMDYTVVTANTFQSVSVSTLIRVPCGASKTITVGNVSPSVAALVKDANIIIKRLA